MKFMTTLIAMLVAAVLLAPGPATALCAVEGKLEVVRLDLDQALAFVLQVRPPRGVVPNAFHVERTPNGGLGDIPVLIQLLNLANPANTTVLAVGDLASCPDAAEIERARAENKAVYSGRLLRVFVKYR
ncbi:MAG TPA: hypothetical protein VGX21_19545 [Methylomirabilota bacterium]|nr:hypothetical protein [Methylomirabilota bacterium]